MHEVTRLRIPGLIFAAQVGVLWAKFVRAKLYRAAGKSDRFILPVLDYWKDAPVLQITSGAVKQAAINLLPTAGPATRNRQVIVPTQAIINHAASLEPNGIIRVIRDIRLVEQALGDGAKTVLPSELPIMQKLRRIGL